MRQNSLHLYKSQDQQAYHETTLKIHSRSRICGTGHGHGCRCRFSHGDSGNLGNTGALVGHVSLLTAAEAAAGLAEFLMLFGSESGVLAFGLNLDWHLASWGRSGHGASAWGSSREVDYQVIHNYLWALGGSLLVLLGIGLHQLLVNVNHQGLAFLEGDVGLGMQWGEGIGPHWSFQTIDVGPEDSGIVTCETCQQE